MDERIKWRCVRAAARFALAFAIFAAAARATTIQRMSLAKMAQAAPAIVRALCTGNSVAWDAGEIWTFTSFTVEETWRGETPARITVRLLGGSMGEITSHVSGVPRFRPGEDVVLFLQPTQRADFSVVSWEQGTFRIRGGPDGSGELVTQDTASFATFDPASRRFKVGGIHDMPLENFRARVQAAVRQAEGRQP